MRHQGCVRSGTNAQHVVVQLTRMRAASTRRPGERQPMQTARRVAIAFLSLVLLALAPLASADPPSRVIRLSAIDGAVSFAAAGSDDWVFATLNRPLVDGDRLWMDHDGRG